MLYGFSIFYSINVAFRQFWYKSLFVRWYEKKHSHSRQKEPAVEPRFLHLTHFCSSWSCDRPWWEESIWLDSTLLWNLSMNNPKSFILQFIYFPNKCRMSIMSLKSWNNMQTGGLYVPHWTIMGSQGSNSMMSQNHANISLRSIKVKHSEAKKKNKTHNT